MRDLNKSNHPTKYDLTGQNFGHWKVIKRSITKPKMGQFWECLCTNCNIIYIVGQNSLLRKTSKSCKKCGYKLQKFYKGNENPKWKGCGKISGSMWKHIEAHAKNRNILFNITIQDAWNKFLQQECKCALTNVNLHFGTPDEKPTASLDRIDSNKAYTINNIQWLHKDVNLSKWNLKQRKYINICKKVAKIDYQKQKEEQKQYYIEFAKNTAKIIRNKENYIIDCSCIKCKENCIILEEDTFYCIYCDIYFDYNDSLNIIIL